MALDLQFTELARLGHPLRGVGTAGVYAGALLLTATTLWFLRLCVAERRPVVGACAAGVGCT